MLRASALTLICAVLASTVAACGSSDSGSGGDADPASLVPAGAALYAQAAVQPTGDRRDGRARRRRQAPAHRRPRGQAPPGDRQGAGQGGRRLHLGEGLRAVAGRGRRRLGVEPRGRRARLRGDRRDQGRRGRPSPRSQRFKEADEDHRAVHEALARRRRLRGRRREHGDRHGRRLPRRSPPRPGSSAPPTWTRAATASPTPTATRTRSTTSSDDSLGHYFVDVKSIIDAALQGGPRGGAAARAGQGVLPGRQARPDQRLVPGRRRRHVARHGAHRHPRGPVPRPRRALGRQRDPSCSRSCRATPGPPSRRRRSASRRRRCSTRSPARSAARRSRRRSSRPPASTWSRTSSPGSATSASSRAARPRPTSTARS